MVNKRNYPDLCPLVRKRSFKKVRGNLRADFVPFLQLTFSLVEFTLGLNVLIKNFFNRLMIHRGYLFVKCPINKS